jgi:hypothetical protein
MDPVKVKREDCLILWTFREYEQDPTMVQMRGRVYYKDEPIRLKPRLLAEVLIPKDQIENITMTQAIALAEERVCLDLSEIAGETGHEEEGIDSLREAMVR